MPLLPSGLAHWIGANGSGSTRVDRVELVERRPGAFELVRGAAPGGELVDVGDGAILIVAVGASPELPRRTAYAVRETRAILLLEGSP